MHLDRRGMLRRAAVNQGVGGKWLGWTDRVVHGRRLCDLG